MNKTYNNCQSCGMPMKKDPQGGGININGTKSVMYCSYCYQNGAFTPTPRKRRPLRPVMNGFYN